MKKTLLLILAILIILCTSGCTENATTSTATPTVTAPAQKTTSVKEEPTPEFTPEPTPEPTAAPITVNTGRKLSEYTLSVSLNTDSHTLTVDQKLNYVNNTDTALDDIYFNLIPEAFRADGGGVNMQSVSVDGENSAIEQVKETVYRLPLPSELAAGNTAEISMLYTVMIPNIRNRFGYQESAYNLGNFIATPAVYGDNGWTVEPYVDVGDAFYTETARYTVTITVPEGYDVAATGEETAPGTYRAEDVRDFAFCASDSWTVEEAEQDGIGIKLYYDGDAEKTAECVINTAQRSLALFSEKFGPYPYDTLNIVMNRLTGGVNGMEYPMLVMISPGVTLDDMEGMGFDLDDKYSIASCISTTEQSVCHEIAHQWFYGVVGNDQVTEPWLDEGMCRFAEYLYQTEYPPETDDPDILKSLLVESQLESWHEWVLAAEAGDTDKYAPDTTYLDKDLYYWQADDPIPYSEIYYKGAALVYEIQQQMGEDAFESALKEYVRRFAYGIVTTESFREFWNEKTDTTRIFELYFREN